MRPGSGRASSAYCLLTVPPNLRYDIFVEKQEDIGDAISTPRARSGLGTERNQRKSNKTRRLQAALDLGNLHKEFPDFLRAVIFQHDQDRPLVDSQDVGIPPVGREIERVAETVAGPDICPELIIE